MYDVAIIGAGIIGGLIARELSKYRLSVCLLEKENDVSMGTTKANSAIVHAGFDAKPNSLKAKFNVEGSLMMEKVAHDLGVSYKRNGSIVVGYNDADRKQLELLLERGKENGVKDLKIIEKEELMKIEPHISENVICALYAPTGAIISPYELAIAAVGNAMDNGAELIRNFEVKAIKKENDVFTISSENSAIESKYIINAAGLFADSVASMAGDDTIKIHPRRGEYMLLDSECGFLANTTIFTTPSKMGKGILVSPTVHGNIILGPTAEDIDDKFDLTTTAQGLDEVKKGALEKISSIPLGKVITSFAGLRAVSEKGDFTVEESKITKGLINVAGIESPGLSASPAIAKYVSELIGDMCGGLCEKENFNGMRKSAEYFKHLSLEEKNKMIKDNPSFGKIVCRCETITEGEIIESLHTNPKPLDLDGVKRRTRSGMGRCQGGFCSPSVLSLIAKETGMAFTDVTKAGEGSEILVGKIR